MKRQAYIGVSGFMARAEVDAALASFPPCGRLLMVGVLASAKTITGQPNKYPRRYPKPFDIAGIFSDDPRCLNLLHYASDETDEFLYAIAGVVRPYASRSSRCHGVQFNGAWPSRNVLDGLRRRMHWLEDPRIVLQIGPGLLHGTVPVAELVERVARYGALVTDVLVDWSGGRGRLFSRLFRETATINRVDELVRDLLLRGVGVGVAGGLCAEALGDAKEPALRRFGLLQRYLSIDAESRLRDDAPDGGNLDLGKVGAYLNAAAKLPAAFTVVCVPPPSPPVVIPGSPAALSELDALCLEVGRARAASMGARGGDLLAAAVTAGARVIRAEAALAAYLNAHP